MATRIANEACAGAHVLCPGAYSSLPAWASRVGQQVRAASRPGGLSRLGVRTTASLLREQVAPQRIMVAFIPFSFELGQDWDSIVAELGRLLADGLDVLDTTKMLTGTGTNEPVASSRSARPGRSPGPHRRRLVQLLHRGSASA